MWRIFALPGGYSLGTLLAIVQIFGQTFVEEMKFV